MYRLYIVYFTCLGKLPPSIYLISLVYCRQIILFATIFSLFITYTKLLLWLVWNPHKSLQIMPSSSLQNPVHNHQQRNKAIPACLLVQEFTISARLLKRKMDIAQYLVMQEIKIPPLLLILEIVIPLYLLTAPVRHPLLLHRHVVSCHRH